MLANIVAAVFPLIMLAATVSDLLTMRIPNVLVLLLAALFFVVAAVAGLAWPELAMHAAGGLLVLGAGFALFAVGWIGGGDAKFAAATALWLGFGQLTAFLVYSALLGGLLTVVLLAVRRWPLPAVLARVPWIGRLHDRTAGVPYGIALGASGLLVYAQTDLFGRLLA